MKRVTSVLAAAALALVVGASSVQAQTLVVGAGGGAVIPSGKASDVVKTGWHGAGVLWYILPSNIGFRGDFVYAQLKVKGTSENFKLTSGIANVSYMFKGSKNLTPYVIGSVGYFNTKVLNVSNSDVGFGGGAGVLISTGGKLKIALEGRYISIQTSGSKTNIIPVTAVFAIPIGK